ncbi:MAG TPA: ABC transporter permease [Gemmatimonadaceae bacterium]|nr:ABC transporter permease [Gemmatimonadaceae bacterium]
MDTLLQDLRFGLRSLLRSPGFTTVAVVALALGIGATSAIFSIVNGVVLRPLPYAHADRAAQIWSRWPGYDKTWLSGPEIEDYRRLPVFDSFGAWFQGNASLTGDGEPERVRAAFIERSVLPTLGAQPMLGRNFTAEEDTPDTLASRVAIIGHGLWRRRYAGDPAIVGKTIQVGLRPFTVVGVMPDEFRLPNDFVGEPIQMYMPAGLPPNPAPDTRGNHGAYGVARFAAGVTAERAQAAMAAFVKEMRRQYSDNYDENFEVLVVPVREEVSGKIRPALLIMLGAVGLVLLIACANVANLLLARAEARHKELAIRTALGAGRGRLVRQMLTESVLLAGAGAALGLLLAFWGTRALLAFSPPNIPRLDAVGVDGRVVAFTLAVAVLTALIFGLAPALQASGTDVHDTLKEGGRGASAGVRRQRVRRTLVVAEVALAMVLVVGAGLLIKSFARLMGIDAGVRKENVLTMELSLPGAKYPQPQSRRFYAELQRRVTALPGVVSAGLIREMPFANDIGDWGVRIVGRSLGPGHQQMGPADWQVATPGYFEAMGIPLRRGRYLDASDVEQGLQTVVINEKMAATFWPNEDPIGRQIVLGGGGGGPDSLPRTVVGIVADVKHRGLDSEAKTQMFLPHAQFPRTGPQPLINRMSLVVRTRGNPLTLTSAVRGEIRALDPEIPVSRVKSLEQVLATSASVRKLNVMLLGIFAGVALLLAAVGIYGVMAYTVTQRTKELGVRMALGATAHEVQGLMLRQGMTLVVVGAVVGIVAAGALGGVLRSLLFGVSSTDVSTYVVVTAVLAAVAAVATFVPARRATKVDPVVALRAE